jgi:translation initiation factor 2B subunit (eIF-2B alpha/beta/delta family)
MLSSLGIIERHLGQWDNSNDGNRFKLVITEELQEYARARNYDIDGIWSSFKQILDRATSKISTEKQEQRPIRLLTLSLSSTIAACLERAIRQCSAPFDIRILESRPLFEGVSLASSLAERLRNHEKAHRTAITIYTDASSALAAANIDIVLLGADLIDKSGAVSNKVGSLPAVLAARYVAPSAQVVVLAEKEKVLPIDPPSHPEENDTKEVTTAWTSAPKLGEVAQIITNQAQRDGPGNEGVSVSAKNVYFEWVTSEMIDVFAFEDQTRQAKDIHVIAAEKKRTFDWFFEGM